MHIEITDLMYKDCLIVPFENLEGKIVGLIQSHGATEIAVRYFLNGAYAIDNFYDFDIELKDDNNDR